MNILAKKVNRLIDKSLRFFQRKNISFFLAVTKKHVLLQNERT